MLKQFETTFCGSSARNCRFLALMEFKTGSPWAVPVEGNGMYPKLGLQQDYRRAHIPVSKTD